MVNEPMNIALRSALAYLLLGGLWIVASDYLLLRLVPDLKTFPSWQTYKGWIYIAITAAIVYVIIYRLLRTREAYETVLRNREGDFNYLFSITPHPSFVYDDRTLQFLAVNDAALRLYGYTRDEFLSMKVTRLRPPETADVFLTDIQLEGSRTEHNARQRHLLKDGRTIEVEIASHMLRFMDRDAMLVVAQDMTEHNLIAAQALENQRLRNELEREIELRTMRSRFTSMISHEFRNPLTRVAVAADMIARYSSHWTPERVRERVDDIQNQINAMVAMLDEILLIMKTEVIESSIQFVPVDLSALCARIQNVLAAQTENNHQIEFIPPESPVIVQGDEKLLHDAVNNLLINALKYSASGTTVKLAIETNDRAVTLSVTDQGIGIPEDALPRLFDPFYRASNTGQIPGSGLGLAIVKRAVDLHKGEVKVHSVLGKGTTFRIELPHQPNPT